MKTPLFRLPSPRALLVPCALLLIVGQLPFVAFAQESSASSTEEDSGEALVLSPFEVRSAEDRGYAGRSLAGTRLRDSGSAISVITPQFLAARGPSVPVTLIRKADAVVIEFALSNSEDKQEGRNKELTDSVDLIAKAIKAIPGLRFENREVQLSTANRSSLLIGKGGVVTSFANFAVFADLSPDVRLYERVKQVRGLVSAAKLAGSTKVLDGPVALFVKRPTESRGELLAKIFADLDAVKKGLGAEFEVLVSGLSGPVQLRSCSESEVELWLDYSFSIRSLREMESKRPVKL